MTATATATATIDRDRSIATIDRDDFLERHLAGLATARRRGGPMSEQLLPFQRLDAYVVAKELARRVHSAKIRD